MPNLGSLWYTLGIDSKQLDADLKAAEAKLKNLGVTVDVSNVRKTIEASVGATPFNATVNFGNARASLDAIFANKKYDVHVEAIASKLHDSIKNALANFSTGANILPKKKELRKAVNDALLSAGFEINIGRVKGLNATINNMLGSAHTLNVSVDPQKLASAIGKAAKAYKGKDISVGVKDKVLHDSIRQALKTEKFPIRVIVDKAEAQDAVRQALQAAGLQSSIGFTASDRRAWDAQSRRIEAEARAAAANALAQRRLAGAQRQAANATDRHTTATLSLSSALQGNITLSRELGGAIGAAYSVVALKNFMTKVVEIGGELEQQKLAMKAILGDEGMANTISSQINTLAVKSPFGIMELNQYAKQLTAFQIPYNELYDTMKRMADVSAAVGVDMGRIILAYGQVRAAKFLKGCLGKGTLVTMLNGSQKKVEDIVAGDVVMGDDEKGRNVLSLIRNREMMYVVNYHGGSFRCNENHILTMYDRKTDKITDVYVLDYLKDTDKYLGVRRVNGAYEYFNMTVERDCVDDYYGFEIDGNKRFLIEDNVVTHNTELRQFTEANIPLIDMLAERFTKLKGEIVSAGDIMDMVSNKEISFEDVKAVLWELTGEGGRFYNMQEVLSESTKAKWKNLADAIDLMFADVAESTSGPLKGLAELLTVLTSKWDLLGAALASATIVFGVAKVSTLAWNAALSKSTLNAIAQAKATKQVEAANLQVSSTYRTLTAAEQGLIRTKGKLTAAQYVQLATTGRLTKEEALRLIALKKLDANTIGHIRGVLNISKAEVSAAQSAKAWRVRLEQLKVSLAGFGRSIAAALLNPVTLAMMAIGSLAALWQRHSAAMSAAKQVGDDIFTKASEGATNLKKTLNTLKPAEGLSDIDLTQGIEKMEQAIKDYSPTPINDINEALTTQDGHLLTLAERYEALKKKLGEIKDAFDGIQFNKVNKAVENALADTKEGWFFDGLEQNLKDYENAKSILDKHIRDYSVEHKEDLHNIVESASKQSEAYQNAIQNMSTDAQKFYELIFNGGRYSKDLDINLQGKIINATEGGFWQNAGENITNLDLRGTGQRINAAYKELIADAKKLKERFNVALSEIGIDPKNITSEQLSIALNSMLDKFEVGEDTKMMFAKKLEELYNITLIDDKVTPIFTEKFREIANASSNEAVQEAMIVWQTQGWSKLSATQKKLLEDIFEQTKTQSKGNVEAIVGDMNTYLATHPGQWDMVINMVTSQMQKEMPDWTRNAISSRGGVFKGSKAAFGYLETWGKDGSQYGARNAAQQALQDAENELKSYVTEADRLTPAYQKAVQKKADIQEAINYLGWGDIQTKDQKSNKHSKGSQKDLLAESLKQRFKDIKDAWSEFQKWGKTEGREAAAIRIGESGLFSTLSKDKIPQTVEQYRALVVELENELRSAGVKGTARESLLNDLLKQLLDIDKTVVDEQLKLALDKVSKEAERQLANYNLFKKLEQETGNRQFAMNFAFGIGMSGQTDYESLIKDKFNAIAKAYKSTLTFDTATPDLLAKAPEEVRKAWEEAYSEIQKYRDKEREELADMVAQYRTTQEEIVALTAEAEEKKRKIRESNNLNPVEKHQVIAKIDSDLNYEVFRKSGEYLKFFNAILSMTGREAESVGQKIKEALDEKLKAGTISAKDYCDEMEKIDRQLETIRRKQKGFGGFGSFAKGGLQQMLKDRFNQAQSDYNSAVQNQTDAAEKRLEAEKQIAQYTKNGDFSSAMQAEGAKMQAQSAMDAASAMKEGAASSMQGAEGAMATMAVIDTIVHGINNLVQGIKGSFDLIADLADSLGVDTSADTGWGEAAAFLDAFSQASQHATDAWDSFKSGNVGGVIQGVIGSITSWFTTFNRWHDAVLQKQIERSQEIVQNLQYAYDAIERRMGSFLGNAKYMYVDFVEDDIKKLEELNKYAPRRGVAGSYADKKKDRLSKRIAAYEEGGAYGYQRQLMAEQLEELEGQRRSELDKKDSDNSVVKDYEDQIDEMKVQIRQFAEEAANDLYGIDLNGWAQQIGDALVDAFAKGEDAAEAFDKTVGDIMRSVVSKVISTGIIAPMMQDLQEFLFGKEGAEAGKRGAFGDDFELQPDEIATLGQMLQGIKGGIGKSKELYDQVNELLGGALDDVDSKKSGLSAGIQSVTEDTADLLASYVNAIRASVALNEGRWERLLGESLPQISVIAQSQLDAQKQIAENTLRNAVAAEAIVKSNDDISRLLTRVTQGGAKFYIH